MQVYHFFKFDDEWEQGNSVLVADSRKETIHEALDDFYAHETPKINSRRAIRGLPPHETDLPLYYREVTLHHPYTTEDITVVIDEPGFTAEKPKL